MEESVCHKMLTKKAYINYFKTKKSLFVIAVTGILFVFLEVRFSINFLSYSDSGDAFEFLRSTLGLFYLLFTGVLLSSYFFFYGLAFSKLHIMVSANDFTKIRRTYYWVLMSVVLMFYLITTFWVQVIIGKAIGYHKEMVACIFKVSTIYFGLGLVLAVKIGEVCAFFKNKIHAIIVLLFSILLSSPVLESFSQISISDSSVMYDVVRWFQFAPRNTQTMVYSICGISSHWTRGAVTVMWIMITELVFTSVVKKYSKCRFLLCLSITLVCAIGYTNAPWFGDEMPNAKTYPSDHCFFYYEKHKQMEEKEDFHITAYDMDFTMNNYLKAKVEVTINALSNEKESYAFTLHHQYCVDSIQNAYGEELDYKEEGDIIWIDGRKITDKIIFFYHGNAAGAYANSEWSTLQSEFCFYPMAGKKKLYDESSNTYSVLNLQDKIHFKVHVKTNQKMYCNLPSTARNTFEGISTNITLRSGYLKQVTYRDVTIIYPCYSPKALIKEATLKKSIDELYQILGDFAKGKLIFADQQYAGPTCLFYEDYMELSSLGVSSSIIQNHYEYYIENGKNGFVLQ